MAQAANFGPVVDGHVVPADVYAIFAKGKQNVANVLVGSNKDEGPDPQLALHRA